MPVIVAFLGLTAALVSIEGIRRLRHSRSSVHHRNDDPSIAPPPPGPVGLPFLGNIIGLNMEAPYLTYMAWTKTYGNLINVRVLGQEIIVLNSEELAVELLEKRSNIYSDRPVLSIAELFGMEWLVSLTPYGTRFRMHRRLLHQVLHAKSALTYRPRQIQSAYEMIQNLLEDPTHYTEHFTKFAASVVMSVTYGYDMKEGETFVASMQHAIHILLHVCTPEISALCSTFPFVLALPTWFPGMGFLSKAAESRSLVSDVLHAPYAWTKRRIDEGNAAPSMVADAITRHHLYDDSKDPELVRAVKEAASTLYAGAVETTPSTLLVFVYLMMNHPEVQQRAQADIDRVVGRQRLPNFDDRESLPYVDAVFRETMRWCPVLPVGVPHSTTEDDVYNGYRIPKGVIVMGNVWAMSRNEKKYSNPEAFIPDRFLREDGTLTEDTFPWIFGFGRRICPGRHVADATLWSAIVCILALFRIEKTAGSENIEWATGLKRHPLPFPCRFVPRDEKMDRTKLASFIDVSEPLDL